MVTLGLSGWLEMGWVGIWRLFFPDQRAAQTRKDTQAHSLSCSLGMRISFVHSVLVQGR